MTANSPDLDEGLALSPAVREDPYPTLRSLRETASVAETPFGWLLTRHADCAAAIRDPRLSNDGRNADPTSAVAQRRGGGRDAEDTFMLFLDPPDHTRLRGLVGRAFTPRTVERLRARAEELVRGMLDAVEARGDGAMDVIADLAYPLPAIMICELMGVPVADRTTLQGWSRDLALAPDPAVLRTEDQRARILAAEAAFTDYFTRLIDRRRQEPGDDLLSALVAVPQQGDRLSHRELLTMSRLLFFGGHETTANLIGNAVHALLEHPGELARLRDDPSLAGNAVEEALRYDSPVQITQRFTLVDYEVGGTTIPAGQQVIPVVAAANRDPEVFPDPDRLDLGRDGAHRHLSFGGGPHFCLGAALARLEGQVAVSALVQRFPAIEPAGEPSRRPTITLRGFERLPVATGPAAAPAGTAPGGSSW